MNITGIVVWADPERTASVRDALERIAGVEVHAVTEDGRMVVTVEQCGEHASREIFDAVATVAGVLSTSLVYHHDETIGEGANH